MNAQIEYPKVEHVGFAAVPEQTDGQWWWRIFLMNRLADAITNVLIASNGYGEREGTAVSTSVLRHYFEVVDAGANRFVELIPPKLTGLSNQLWLSYYLGEKLYDKKFIFLPETLLLENTRPLPGIDQSGILIL